MARVTDVTGRLIQEVYGPGEYAKRAREAKPAFKLTPTLVKFLEAWRRPSDKTVGFVSQPLVYSNAFVRPSKSHHTNMVRLVKGGNINVCEVHAPPPEGSNAYRESRYGDRFYFLKAGPCPTEIEPSAATFTGARKRRR
jgi:hypothetical protein